MNTAEVARPAAELPYPAPAVGWYATVMLALLYWLSVLDRLILSLLVDPIQKDLGLNDQQFAMLHGLAFVGAFTIFGLVFGALTDRVNRRKLIYVGVTIWSVATAACGFAKSFWHLLAARVGVGVGEASLNPAASSMIADLFPRAKQTSAMAVYALGATVGSGTALLVGGAIVEMVSHLEFVHLPLIGAVRPWQAVFLFIGVPGALVAFCIFTVPEPVRRGKQQQQQDGGILRSYAGFLKFLVSRGRFFACHYVGFIFAFIVITGGAAWYPSHMSRTFGWSPGQIGAALGPTLMVAGIVSKLASGWIADRMYQRGYRDAQLRWYGCSMLVAAPIGVYACLSANVWVFVTGIGVFMTLVGASQACALTALNLVTPNEMRGTGVAIFNTVSSLLGGVIGPWMIAATAALGETSAIGRGLAITIGICCPLGGGVLLLALRPMRESVARMEQSLLDPPAS